MAAETASANEDADVMEFLGMDEDPAAKKKKKKKKKKPKKPAEPAKKKESAVARRAREAREAKEKAEAEREAAEKEAERLALIKQENEEKLAQAKRDKRLRRREREKVCSTAPPTISVHLQLHFCPGCEHNQGYQKVTETLCGKARAFEYQSSSIAGPGASKGHREGRVN